MQLVLDGFTAFEYWMTSIDMPERLHINTNAPLTDFSPSACTDLVSALRRTDGADGAFDLLVRLPEDRRSAGSIHCRAWGTSIPLPSESICQIGDDILAVSPELCLVRIATTLSRLELVRAITDMCAIYARSPLDHTVLIPRKPITNIQRIANLLDQLEGMRGVRAVRQVLPWCIERTASPRETTIDIELALPTRLGGQNLTPFQANLPIPLSRRARQLASRNTLIGDVVWQSKFLVLEFNSDSYHDTEVQQVMDFEKITAYRSTRYTCIPMSTRQFEDYGSFQEITTQARRHLGIRDRTNDSVEERRERVHEQLLQVERQQRRQTALIETARWRYLLPRLGTITSILCEPDRNASYERFFRI